MTRIQWGAMLWVLAALALPLQAIVAMLWSPPYSWSTNFISDLGVTSCGVFDVGSPVERSICSPAHVLANASTVANGALLATGAVLLLTTWPRRRTGNAAMLLIAAAGLFVAIVGFLPWNLYPPAHDNAAFGQAVAQWAGMIVLVFALRGNPDMRWMSTLTVTSLAVSMIAFVFFVDATSKEPSVALGVGITERVAFDILTLWGMGMGILMLLSPTFGDMKIANSQDHSKSTGSAPSVDPGKRCRRSVISFGSCN